MPGSGMGRSTGDGECFDSKNIAPRSVPRRAIGNKLLSGNQQVPAASRRTDCFDLVLAGRRNIEPGHPIFSTRVPSPSLRPRSLSIAPPPPASAARYLRRRVEAYFSLAFAVAPGDPMSPSAFDAPDAPALPTAVDSASSDDARLNPACQPCGMPSRWKANQDDSAHRPFDRDRDRPSATPGLEAVGDARSSPVRAPGRQRPSTSPQLRCPRLPGDPAQSRRPQQPLGRLELRHALGRVRSRQLLALLVQPDDAGGNLRSRSPGLHVPGRRRFRAAAIDAGAAADHLPD